MVSPNPPPRSAFSDVFGTDENIPLKLSILPVAAWVCGCLLSGVPCLAQAHQAAPSTRKFAYTGAALSTYPRLSRAPGRVFEDFQGRPTLVPRFLAANGFNAVRVLVTYGQPAVTHAVNNSDYDHREANYQLDFGGQDWQIALAKEARRQGQKVVLTLQFGQEKPALGADNWHEFIPDAWLGLSYAQTLGKIDAGTRQLLRPFLQAGVQPDILIVENESDSGMLFQTVNAQGRMVVRDTKSIDPFSDSATGNFSNWPKCAGYYKREILSVKDELKREGFNPARTRIAVHGSTTPGHTRFLFNNIFHNKPDADSVYYAGGVPKGVVTAVPASLRKLRLCDLVDIMGFSFYPDPPPSGTPTAFAASLKQMTDDLAYFSTILPRYGRAKQCLVIEFGVPTDKSVGFDVPRQQQFVKAFFQALAPYPWTLGALWWEPAYARNNWSHDEGSLYRVTAWDTRRQDYPAFKPVATIRTWGSFAAPPAKTLSAKSLSASPISR